MHKAMEVCSVCGSLLVVGDIQSRLDEHTRGKQHAGYAKIRASLERVIVSKRTLAYGRLITRAHEWSRQKWLMLKAMFCIVATESATTWTRTKPSCGKTSAFFIHSRQTSMNRRFPTLFVYSVFLNCQDRVDSNDDQSSKRHRSSSDHRSSSHRR